MWVHALSGKNDAYTAREWQLKNADEKLRSKDQLRKCIERMARALEAVGRSVDTSRESTRSRKLDRHVQSYQ